MTPTPPTDQQPFTLLANIDPEKIADESVLKTVIIRLNHIEDLSAVVNTLKAENQQLRDEINRLKGEQGKPNIKPNRGKGSQSNHSSERERKKPQPHQKASKNEYIKIDREQVLEVPVEQLPVDAVFKGYEDVIVQDVKLSTDNVLFRKEKYYSPSEGKTNLASVPFGYEGQFGPGLKALVVSQYFQGNMTQGKLLEFLSDIGISISAGQLSNLLIKDHQAFHTEKQEVYQAGLASSPWHHLDQTSARVGGKNQTCNVVCNPLYTVYHTSAKKDRMTVLEVLQGGQERQFLLNVEAFELLKSFNLPQKIMVGLQHLPFATMLGEAAFLEQLHRYLPKLGKIHLSRICVAVGKNTGYPGSL